MAPLGAVSHRFNLIFNIVIINHGRLLILKIRYLSLALYVRVIWTLGTWVEAEEWISKELKTNN